MRQAGRVTEMPLLPPTVVRLSGAEPIAGADATVNGFWSWAFSDMRSNVTRSMLAEYLVAVAVHADDLLRIEWAPFDVRTPTGIKIEVKSTARLQAWPQKQPSSLSFGKLLGRLLLPNGSYETDRTLNSDVYVFAVVGESSHERYNALDVVNWEFWVVPVRKLAALNQQSVSLASVRRLADAPVPYARLAEEIELAGRTAST